MNPQMPTERTEQPKISPSSISALYEPQPCERRVWLRESSPVTESEPAVFEQFLFEQGLVHEERVTASLRDAGREIVDLDGFEEADRIAATAEAIAAGSDAVICQGQLRGEIELGGQLEKLTGRPDFLLMEGDSWVIADAKLTRKIYRSSGSERSEKKAIFLQLRFYGLLFEQSFPGVPFELRVYNGSGGADTIEFRGAEGVVDEIARFVRLRDLAVEPFEQVGLSKCGACGFKPHCWPAAEEAGDLGLLPSISQAAGSKLRDAGINTIEELAADGGASESVAPKMVEDAQALMNGAPVRRRDGKGGPIEIDPAVSSDANYVMFDLEGMPPELDEDQRVYLWGMQVFGEEPGPFHPVLAGFGEDGDREGWEEFLATARSILDERPGIRFVHWHSYEKTLINMYVKLYGDDSHGTAAEVVELLLDLLPITKRAVAIPAPGYSLKLVEKLDAVRDLTGFARGDGAVGKGDDSIVAFARAAATEDPAERESIMAALCEYNREDLEATWAVQQWLALINKEA